MEIVEQEKTFPNTNAALNGQMVSGNVRKVKEHGIDNAIRDIESICLDIEDSDKDLHEATIRALARYIRDSLNVISDTCEHMIGVVQAEEHNANLPPEEDGEQNV